MSIISDSSKLVEGSLTKPGVLGIIGKRIERRCADDMRSYFRELTKQIIALEIPKLVEGNTAEIGKHSAMMRCDHTLRSLTPMLLNLLSINIYEAMSAADKQDVLKETPNDTGIDRLGLSGQEAADYAARHAATLVTNLNDTTRVLIGDAVADGITEQLGVDGLARALRSFLEDMSIARSRTIAGTEMNAAMSEASLRKMKRIGVRYKQVILSPDACPVCEENDEVGPIPVDEAFPSGDLRTPFHPNCRCAVTGARPPEGEAEDEE